MNLCHGLRVLQNQETESTIPPLVLPREENVHQSTEMKLLAAL